MSRSIYTRFQGLLQALGWFYGLALAGSAGALWAFFEVAEEAIEEETVTLNREILLAVHAHAHPIGDAVALALAGVGSVWGITLVGAAFGLWLWRRGSTIDALTLGAALTGTAGLTFVLKATYHQARPDLFPRLVNEVTFSFPSGHSSMSLCLYGFIAGWLVAQAPRELWRWQVGVICVAFAVSIGLSRIYLGVHWPTDVVAGMLIASFWLAVCLVGRRWLG